MRLKRLSKWPPREDEIGGVVLASVLLLFIAFSTYDRSPQVLAVSQVSKSVESVGGLPDVADMGLPLRLRIPKIGVDAAIEPVGLTPLGAMDAPASPADAAWFSPGTRPGEEGSAVISGHYGWKDNIPAVFDSLHSLRKGDLIYVEDGEGATTAFVVREVRTYDERADASGVFSSDDDRAHLNLITCQGIWNKAGKSYADRLVVFSDRVTVQ